MDLEDTAVSEEIGVWGAVPEAVTYDLENVYVCAPPHVNQARFCHACTVAVAIE